MTRDLYLFILFIVFSVALVILIFNTEPSVNTHIARAKDIASLGTNVVTITLPKYEVDNLIIPASVKLTEVDAFDTRLTGPANDIAALFRTAKRIVVESR
jgi:hypothetical protein